MAFQIEVRVGGTWRAWSTEGGGDAVQFASAEEARAAALATGELQDDDAGHTWRVSPVDGWPAGAGVPHDTW